MSELTEREQQIANILTEANTIAVVGHSDNPNRESYEIAQYLRFHGYTVYPVNPTIESVDGEPSYPSLAALPEKPDIVNVFRRSEYLGEIIDAAIRVRAPVVWAQIGIVDEAAAQRGREAGLQVIMDQCIRTNHRRLIGQAR